MNYEMTCAYIKLMHVVKSIEKEKNKEIKTNAFILRYTAWWRKEIRDKKEIIEIKYGKKYRVQKVS